MKVISGTLKGRKIEGYDLDGTRPTMDRVKESLFAMIQDYIDESVVLDLFSGSGNLGIEAISNGSKKVYFNDMSKNAIHVINKNVNNFSIKEKSIIINFDYKKCLDYLKENSIKLDIIFLDPPYKNEILNEVIKYIKENEMLNNNGIIVCEISNNYINENYYKIIKQKKYGDKEIIILK